jgi:fluoroacetyl-CoA thioesterase
MKPSLAPGLSTSFSFTIPESKTVPELYPEAPEFQTMPRVFATGFMVGLTVRVEVTLDRVEGRRLTFSVSAHDGIDEICRGTHERFVIDTARFEAKVEEKRKKLP